MNVKLQCNAQEMGSEPHVGGVSAELHIIAVDETKSVESGRTFLATLEVSNSMEQSTS